jgi:hypothetical protein
MDYTNYFHQLYDRLTRHLRENNQGYFEHLKDAWSFSAKAASASALFAIHGIFPFTLEHSGSNKIDCLSTDLHEKLSK